VSACVQLKLASNTLHHTQPKT